jgi:hypothetical protein
MNSVSAVYPICCPGTRGAVSNANVGKFVMCRRRARGQASGNAQLDERSKNIYIVSNSTIERLSLVWRESLLSLTILRTIVGLS